MPYTTEQIESLSILYRANAVTVEDVVTALRECERQNTVRICEYSGEVIEGEPFVVEIVHWRNVPTGQHATWNWRWHRERSIERHYFADEEAAVAFGCRQCDGCGEWIMPEDVDEGVDIYDNWYCSLDCAHEADWEECERCGSWIDVNDAVYIEDGHFYCDEVCAENDGWTRCERCEEWTPDNDLWTVYVNGCEESWCEWCRDDHASYCEECGEYVDEDDMAYDEDLGRDACSSCRGEGSRCSHYRAPSMDSIHSWNYWPPSIKLYGTSPFRMGFELETDSGGDRYAYASELDSIEGFREHCWMKNDGSLCNGVEIVSHPMDLAYHWKLYEEGFHDAIKRSADKHGFVSHNSGNCGLHISMSRDALGKSVLVQDATILKMMRLGQRFEPQLLTFSRRTPDTMERWASFKTYGDYSPKKTKVNVKSGDVRDGVIGKAKEFKANEATKYRAFNICHASHLEVRIFRGTLKWSTFFASLAFVEGLARVAKVKTLEWVENVTWYELVDAIVEKVSVDGPREMLVAYLEEKGLC